MATPPDLPPPARNPEDDPDVYVGLAEADAEQRAREHGWRTVRSLPPGAMITMEFMAGRLNFTVEEGRVTRCWAG